MLREAGFKLANVVKLNYYTTDVDAFVQSSDVLGERLAGVQLSSTLLGVTRLAYREMLVEIEATAVA